MRLHPAARRQFLPGFRRLQQRKERARFNAENGVGGDHGMQQGRFAVALLKRGAVGDVHGIFVDAVAGRFAAISMTPRTDCRVR